MYQLHGPATSPFVRKAWIALKEKELDVARRELDPLAKTPEFLRMNPLGRVPVLELPGGQLVRDSSVICDYLERVHPEPPLYPVEPLERADALWLEEYGDTRLVEITARVFWMQIIIPVRTSVPADPAQIQAYIDEQFPAALDYLESRAPDGSAMVGERFGIADIALAAPLRLLDLAGWPLEGVRWPRLTAYYQRIIERPSARSLYEAETAATEVFRTTGNAPS